MYCACMFLFYFELMLETHVHVIQIYQIEFIVHTQIYMYMYLVELGSESLFATENGGHPSHTGDFSSPSFPKREFGM